MTAGGLARPGAEHGNRTAAMTGEILRTVVGSGVHGLAVPGTDDHDEMGIFTEPPESALGIGPPTEHYVHRTQPEGVRSGPGDTDLVCYSLRKYLRLATKGNPTMLLPLYAPETDIIVATELGAELRDLADAILSQRAIGRFLGYLQSQRERLLGHGSRHGVPNRPELVAAHGYDTKYASHALRLAYQGLEVARDGRITLPMSGTEHEVVLAVKTGQVPDLDDVLHEIKTVETSIIDILNAGTSPLRHNPDMPTLQQWCVYAHYQQWGIVHHR